MQDAHKGRPYYGRIVVCFARVSRKSDESRPTWGEWMCAGSATMSSDQTIKLPWREDTRNMYPCTQHPSIVGTLLVRVLLKPTRACRLVRVLPPVCALRSRARNEPGSSLDANGTPLVCVLPACPRPPACVRPACLSTPSRLCASCRLVRVLPPVCVLRSRARNEPGSSLDVNGMPLVCVLREMSPKHGFASCVPTYPYSACRTDQPSAAPQVQGDAACASCMAASLHLATHHSSPCRARGQRPRPSKRGSSPP